MSHRIQIRLSDEAMEALQAHAFATDSLAIPETRGRVSGASQVALRLVLEALGLEYADPHAIQARERREEAEHREEDRLQRLEDIRAAEALGIL